MLIRGRGRDREHVFHVVRRLVTERETYNDSTPEQSKKQPVRIDDARQSYVY